MSTQPKPPSARWKKIGVTLADYERVLAAQGGRCAIRDCGRLPRTRRFHFDHDHKTGYVRGLLCHWHNRIMPKTSAEAIALSDYLRAAEIAQGL